MNLPQSLFVDSGAWYALFDQRDQYHERAKVFFYQLRDQSIRLVTSNYVFDEALTLLRYHVSHSIARQFGEHFRKSNVVCEEITSEIRESAWQIFIDYDDQEFSFTDCTSFVIMRKQNVQDTFTFDSHFQTMGFNTHPVY
ncbi:MAG: PIN domain-containing protein [Candidatus Latescibacteria bacterium]|nr:PIN domain-containing protein [Candidatus Latescibacterota bacterium]